MRLSELQNKNIVNINDGKMIGNIIDIDIFPKILMHLELY